MRIDNPKVTEIRPCLLRFVRARGMSHEDSEDLVQDVLLRVWLRDIDFETERHLFGYLYTSLRHACANSRRRRGMGFEELGDLASPLPDPAAELQWKETEQIMRGILQGEVPVIRALIDPDGDAPRYADVAAVLGKAEGVLRTTISRRRKVLRAELAKALAA